jgi:hypothetical protein
VVPSQLEAAERKEVAAVGGATGLEDVIGTIGLEKEMTGAEGGRGVRGEGIMKA